VGTKDLKCKQRGLWVTHEQGQEDGGSDLAGRTGHGALSTARITGLKVNQSRENERPVKAKTLGIGAVQRGVPSPQ
jgi:hypothetical protein